MSEEPATVRQQIRAWWRAEIDGKQSVDIKTLAQKGADELRKNPEFVNAFFDEILYTMVYQTGIALLSHDRGQTIGFNDAVRPMKRMTGAQIAAEIETEVRDWSRWLEYDPESGKHISLFSMTKEQALAAAKERENRAEPDLRRAGMLRLAAGRLEAGQKIDEVWTADELSEIERRLELTNPGYSLGQGTIFDIMKRHNEERVAING